MNIGLFLGAGASVPYGFKTTNTIKPIIISETEHSDLSRFVGNILDDNNYPDIEYLLDICSLMIMNMLQQLYIIYHVTKEIKIMQIRVFYQGAKKPII